MELEASTSRPWAWISEVYWHIFSLFGWFWNELFVLFAKRYPKTIGRRLGARDIPEPPRKLPDLDVGSSGPGFCFFLSTSLVSV